MKSIITQEELDFSGCVTGDITPDKVLDFDIVVVGAGAAGVPAAGWATELGAKVALLQKEGTVVSQGNCGSAIIRSRSTEAGIEKWIHHTNSLCDWRADTKQLRAYADHSDPVNKLTPEERQKVIETVKEKRFSSIPPHEIVPYWLF